MIGGKIVTTFEGMIEISEQITDDEWKQLLGVCEDWNEGSGSTDWQCWQPSLRPDPDTLTIEVSGE